MLDFYVLIVPVVVYVDSCFLGNYVDPYSIALVLRVTKSCGEINIKIYLINFHLSEHLLL